jgi:hypothetical protein
MRIIGVDLHARQQTIAMLDTETGELIEKTLVHDGDDVRNFYSALRSPGRPRAGRCLQMALDRSTVLLWIALPFPRFIFEW